MTDATIIIMPSKLLEAAQTAQYTSSGLAVIDAAIVTNTGTTNSALSVNIIEPGSVPGAANLAIAARLIAAGETYLCPELTGQALAAGGIISTLSGGGLAMRITGRLIG